METKQSLEVTCPDCRGPVSECRIEGLVEYRCLVGHTFSPRSILEAHSEAQEKALWAAVVALEEASNIVNAVASEFSPAVAQILKEQAELKATQAQQIREILEQLEPFQLP